MKLHIENILSLSFGKAVGVVVTQNLATCRYANLLAGPMKAAIVSGNLGYHQTAHE